MRARYVFAVVALAFGGCVFHIDTAIPVDSRRFDGRLLGTWESADSARVVITVGQDSSYRVDYRKRGGDSALLHARLGTLGGHTVIEAWPAYADVDDTWPVGRLLLMVDVAGDVARVRTLQRDSVVQAMRSDRRELPHLVHGDDAVLTAPTSHWFQH